MSSSLCSGCRRPLESRHPVTVNVAAHPELKEKVLSGELFICECPACGTKNLVAGDMLYLDPVQKILICLSESNLSSPDDLPDYTCRIVSGAGDLIEKIRIFDAGLDDVVVEMCKFVTSREMDKDVTLRFYRMDGSDNEMIFAWPENGRMEMIAVGFNVYEDCRGIVSRNPSMAAKSSGLIRIDRDWLSEFFR